MRYLLAGKHPQNGHFTKKRTKNSNFWHFSLPFVKKLYILQ